MPATAMFPLNSVLLPHTPIALRIFEPRYLVMLGRMLDEEEPEFGVVLIERGHEAGGGDGRSMIGTMARIVQVEVGAEDMHLVAVGDERISVDRWLEDDPYPRAEVHALPVLEWDDALTPLRAEAERAVRRVLARAAEYGSVLWDPSTELSDDPVASAWQLAGIAPLGEFDRFRLLRSTTMGGLLRQTLDLTLDVEPLLTAPPLEDDDDEP